VGTFIGSTKNIVVRSLNETVALQLDAETTLSFTVYERVQSTPLASIDIQLEKVSGRNSAILQSWTSIDMTPTDDIYSIGITITGVTSADNIKARFKIVDEDGLEYFETINNIKVED